MRILYLHQYFNLPNMVGSTRSLELTKSLHLAGHNVHVITTNRDKKYVCSKQLEGVTIEWHNIQYNNSQGFIQRIIAFLKYIFIVTWKVLFLRYDIIYASSTPLTVLVPALIAHALRRKKYIFEVRDLWPEIPIAMGYLNSTVLKYFSFKLAFLGYKYATSIIPLSNDMALQIVEKYNIDISKIYVLPNFSSKWYFAFTNTEILRLRSNIVNFENSKIVIYPGTFGHVNGVEYILNLAKKLEETEYFFLCIGSGREFSKIKCLSELRQLKNVKVMESIPKDQIFKFISACDYLISTTIDIPELQWNSANKYFDGLCAGKPIILNYKGWQADELKQYNCGIVLDRNLDIASNQLKKIDDRTYTILKNNTLILSAKYDKENIQERLIKILNHEKGLSNMY